MNSQEAITLLRNLEDALDSYCELNEEGKTAFRMAIEALSCSEFPNSPDTISRQAAIDAHERIFDRCEEIEAHLPEGDPDRVGYKMYPDWLTVWTYLNVTRPEWCPIADANQIPVADIRDEIRLVREAGKALSDGLQDGIKCYDEKIIQNLINMESQKSVFSHDL